MLSSKLNEIKIAGAGLAGMTAAINLAMAGYRPIVYELRTDVGMRFAGDFQYFENWTRPEDVLTFLQKANIRLHFPMQPIKAVTAFDAQHRRYHFTVDSPVGYMIRRGCFEDTLDLALKRQAMSVGVRFEFGRKVTPEEVDIVATGPDSSRSHIVVQGITFETDLSDTIWLLFDRRVAPKVYAYLVAHRGRGVACACFPRRYAKAARREAFLRRAMESFHMIQAFKVRKERYFGNYGISPLVTHAENIVVGEAAGFQDAHWGFGIRHAIESGYLAARALIEGQDYWQLIRQEIVPWVESSWVNRYIMERLGDLGYHWLLQTLWKRQQPDRDLSRIYSPRAWKGLLIRCLSNK